jgi:ubiquinone/menaquinone biosynthesis C-methylase UbiE
VSHVVSRHLGIDLREYDARIRSFIPAYDSMLDAAAGALRGTERMVVDLGVGTGALAARCLARAPHAHIVGIDVDEGMLDAAALRLGRRAVFIRGSFLRASLPSCDAIVASLALHHVRTRRSKQELYVRLRHALKRRGRVIVADCYPASDRSLARAQHDAWRAHLQPSYGARQATAYFRAWAKEDAYVPLEAELALMRAATLGPEVVWRNGAFAVIAARVK